MRYTTKTRPTLVTRDQLAQAAAGGVAGALKDRTAPRAAADPVFAAVVGPEQPWEPIGYAPPEPSGDPFIIQ